MFKYAKWTQTCDVFFALFALSWIPTRHGYFFIIPYTCLAHFYPMWEEGSFNHHELGGNGIWWTVTILLSFLMTLQVLLLMWLKLLIRAIMKVFNGNNADDERSSDDDGSRDSPKKKNFKKSQ